MGARRLQNFSNARKKGPQTVNFISDEIILQEWRSKENLRCRKTKNLLPADLPLKNWQRKLSNTKEIAEEGLELQKGKNTTEWVKTE